MLETPLNRLVIAYTDGLPMADFQEISGGTSAEFSEMLEVAEHLPSIFVESMVPGGCSLPCLQNPSF